MALAVLFLVIPTIWVLRARSDHGRLWGLLLPPGIALIGIEIISSPVIYYEHDMPGLPQMWLHRGLSVAMFWFVLSLAAEIYRTARIDSDHGLCRRIS
jgi:hypothetical protein